MNHPPFKGFLKRGLRWVLFIALFIPLCFDVCGSGCEGRRAALRSLNAIQRLAEAGAADELAIALDSSLATIPAGEFTLGSAAGREDERPERQIDLDAYEIDRYEVTQVQYRRYLRATGAKAPRYWDEGYDIRGKELWPVVGVSWKDAQAYCEWTGKRLPTEAEWEKACRGPDGNIYPWGDAWAADQANVGLKQAERWPLSIDAAWQYLQSDPQVPGLPGLQPVGSYLEGISLYGVFDLAGNAAEWALDWYTWEGYANIPERNPVGEGPPWNHSIRGSGWFDRRGLEGMVPFLSRCAARNSSHSADDPRVGFRCARPAPVR